MTESYYERWRAKQVRECSLCGETKPVVAFVKYTDNCVTCRLSVQRCTRCKVIKPLEDFTPDRRRQPSARQSICKPCKADEMRQPRYRAADRVKSKADHRRERRNARLRERWATDPEYRERRRAERDARYAEKATAGLGKAVLAERDGWSCYLCGDPLPEDLAGTDVDHVVPRSLGGPSTPENLRVTHASCNRRKQARLLDPANARLTGG